MKQQKNNFVKEKKSSDESDGGNGDNDDDEEFREGKNMKISQNAILKIAHYLAVNDKNLRGKCSHFIYY